MEFRMSVALKYWILLIISVHARALTEDEILLFQNDGSQGGYVRTSTYQDYHRIEANGLPDHEMDRVNPNTAASQTYDFTIYKNSTIACTPGCLPGGIIGITKTGVAIFNPLDAQGENAVEGPGAETFDRCQGHADNMGTYHYHKIPDVCGIYTGQVDEFIGVALDGFSIYGPKVSDKSELLTSSDLDDCHGRFVNGRYQYHVTFDFPYFLGCFKGTQTSVNVNRVTYECGNDGTHAQEYGYVCGCSNTRVPGQRPPATVAPVVCETLSSSTQSPTRQSSTVKPVTTTVHTNTNAITGQTTNTRLSTKETSVVTTTELNERQTDPISKAPAMLMGNRAVISVLLCFLTNYIMSLYLNS